LSKSNIDTGLFEKLANEMFENGTAQPGTMMGFLSLKAHGIYFAYKDKKSGSMIVKLTEKKVKDLISRDQAEAFAPAGFLYKNWAVMTVSDEVLWRALLRDARELAEKESGKQT
jgi:hypothetical protein